MGWSKSADHFARATYDISNTVTGSFAALAAEEATYQAKETVLACSSSTEAKDATLLLAGVLVFDVFYGRLCGQINTHSVLASGLGVDGRHDGT